MTPALQVLLALISHAEDLQHAMKAVSELMKNAQEQGREVTLDELKGLSLSTTKAIDALTDAISDAEQQG